MKLLGSGGGDGGGAPHGGAPGTAYKEPFNWSLAGNPTLRSLLYQVLLVCGLAGLAWWAASNVADNLRAANIVSGFGFLSNPADFDISQSLVSFSAGMSYGRALLAGLANTLLVAAIGLVLTTLLGFALGVMLLSRNLLVAGLSRSFVEVVRNVPLLLQLLFWYNAVLKPLPGPRQSLELAGGIMLNNRGLYLPWPQFDGGASALWAGLVAALAVSAGLVAVSRSRSKRTGRPLPLVLPILLLMLALPALAVAISGTPVSMQYPTLRGFNLSGGLTVLPEFVALLLGLTLYTAAFIAEIVRSGIASVSHGQTEAAEALGLRPGRVMRSIVLPQALRLIIPPLTSQYLNLIKNSSLAVAIGYPDLVQVGAGPVLQNTGQALEVIALIMLVYLIISLVTSAAMNIYNSRMALVER